MCTYAKLQQYRFVKTRFEKKLKGSIVKPERSKKKKTNRKEKLRDQISPLCGRYLHARTVHRTILRFVTYGKYSIVSSFVCLSVFYPSLVTRSNGSRDFYPSQSAVSSGQCTIHCHIVQSSHSTTTAIIFIRRRRPVFHSSPAATSSHRLRGIANDFEYRSGQKTRTRLTVTTRVAHTVHDSDSSHGRFENKIVFFTSQTPSVHRPYTVNGRVLAHDGFRFARRYTLPSAARILKLVPFTDVYRYYSTISNK